MDICVKLPSGGTVRISATPTDTVRAIKRRVAARGAADTAGCCRLVFAGRELRDRSGTPHHHCVCSYQQPSSAHGPLPLT